jgi:hypothetical protein
MTGCDDLATGAEVNRKQNGAAVAWAFAEAGVDQLSEEAKSFTEIEWAKRHAAKEDKKQMLADGWAKARAWSRRKPMRFVHPLMFSSTWVCGEFRRPDLMSYECAMEVCATWQDFSGALVC